MRNLVSVLAEDGMQRENAESWYEATDRDIQTLAELKTSKLVKLPNGREIVETEWIFDFERAGHGSMSRSRVPLGAKRLFQNYRIDCHQVFSPASRYAAVGMMFSIAVSLTWKRALVHVKDALFNARLRKEIYVDQLDGYVQNDRRKFVYVLRNTLHGPGSSHKNGISICTNFSLP